MKIKKSFLLTALILFVGINVFAQNQIKQIKTIGQEGVKMGEFQLQSGNIWPQSFGADGEYLYVKDANNNRIQRFNKKLKPIDWFGYSDNKWGFYDEDKQGEDELSFINILVKDGFLYLMGGSDLLKVDVETGELVKFYDFSYYFDSRAIAVDSKGNVYIYCFEMTILKFNPEGELIATIGSEGTEDGQFSESESAIVIDSDDNLYVVDTEADRIQKFDSTGTYLKNWEVKEISNVMILHENNLFVLSEEDVFSPKLRQYNLEGELLKTWETDVAFDRFFFYNGKLVAEEAYENELKVYSIDL